eukprot:4761112-Prymnesium_polylepis.1
MPDTPPPPPNPQPPPSPPSLSPSPFPPFDYRRYMQSPSPPRLAQQLRASTAPAQLRPTVSFATTLRAVEHSLGLHLTPFAFAAFVFGGYARRRARP